MTGLVGPFDDDDQFSHRIFHQNPIVLAPNFFFSNSERCISCSHAPPRGRVRIKPGHAPRHGAAVRLRDVRACACTGLRPCRTRAPTAVRRTHVSVVRCMHVRARAPWGRVRIPQDAPRHSASVWMRDVRACACTGLRPCRTRARTAVRCMHVMAGAQPVQ